MPIVANVYFTSFRDNMLMNVALSKGYNVEKSFNKRVNILVYKDSKENNKKVEKALSKNIKVMSRDEFLELLK
jgi:NAD-dependent DNA ligase